MSIWDSKKISGIELKSPTLLNCCAKLGPYKRWIVHIVCGTILIAKVMVKMVWKIAIILSCTVSAFKSDIVSPTSILGQSNSWPSL